MSVGTRHFTLLSALLVLGACENSNAPEYQSDLRVSETTSADLTFYPPPPKLPTPHPWVGKTIRIFDVGENRCFEPDAISAGAKINMSICYSGSGLDLAQRFLVVRAGSVLNGDIEAVSFKLDLNQSLCLEVKNGTAMGGEQIQLATCNSSTSQMFHLPTPKAPFTSGAILTKVSGYKMALEVGASGIGFLVQQQPYPVITQVLRYRYWTGAAYFTL